MARRGSSSNGSSSKSRSRKSSSNGRSSNRSRTRSKQEFEDYTLVDPSDIPDEPDVLLDVPVVKVDEIDLEVEDLHAQVAVLAEVQKATETIADRSKGR